MSNESRKSEIEAPSVVDVPFRGHVFKVSREYNEWSIDLLESLEEGKAVGIVRGALGADQWRTVRAMNLKVRDLNELSDAISAAMGFGSVGESAASSD